MRNRKLGEIGAGPLFPDQGTLGARVKRRAIGFSGEFVGFVLFTLLLPLLVVVAVVADLFFRIKDGKPATALRLVLFGWWFFFTEIWGHLFIAAIWLLSGGPFGKGGVFRRRGIYWLRPRWANSHLGGFKFLFGVKFEIEGLEAADPGPHVIMIRHASIVDNLIPDTTIALRLGIGIRYVIKRELEVLPLIDIGGRWVTTSFLNRASGDPETETKRMVQLCRDLGPSESILIYPEGTRATASKIARAKERIRETHPDVAPLAEQMVNLLPPRLTGPLALLEEAKGLDVVFVGHVGFDGFEYISDIWAGGLNGATIRIKYWRVPAEQIPTDERGRIEWLYEHWMDLDRWVGEQRAELGIEPASGKAVGSEPSAEKVGSGQ